MPFGQIHQLFFPFLLLLEIIISVHGFPFLQEIGADSQHSMLSSSQNLAKEKQPIILSADKGPSAVQKVDEEKFQTSKNAERCHQIYFKKDEFILKDRT
jgi:hypothetical protein